MEKKNFNKKLSKRVSNKPSDELTKKRFSKSKFRKDVRDEQILDIAKKKQFAIRKKKQIIAEEKYEFNGDVTRTWRGILAKSTLQKRGYDLLSKGQCVKVEEFAADSLIRVSTTDGRVGVTNLSDVKKLNFTV
jgi:transposase